jgi:hypothetical protein
VRKGERTCLQDKGRTEPINCESRFYLHGPSRPQDRRTVVICRSAVPHGNESSWRLVESGAGRAGGAAEWAWS